MPVPQGLIALWSGLLANIPANWLLCDGNNGTPNLIARFIRGAPAATEPGTIGGSDTHTHTMTPAGGHTHVTSEQSHSHIVNSAGAHTHGVATKVLASGYGMVFGTASIGGHQHTTSTATHSHTMSTTSDHIHTISTDDGRPPYYEVAFIQAQANAEITTGIIIIWTGTLASIPSGWALCDGGDGRPDLRSRFVRGVNTNITNPGTTGGATTHGHIETAQAAHTHTMNDAIVHNHTFSAYTWTHDHNLFISSGTAFIRQANTAAGNHTHSNSDTIDTHNHNPMGNDGSHAHAVNATSSLPVYYDVAYIISITATSVPQNGILIWTGLLANIPLGYSLCDGGDSRPDLRGKFIRGSDAGIDPGGTGGSDTHTHTDQAAGSHSAHSQTNAGTHLHSATDNIGEHTHATIAAGGSGTIYDRGTNASGGAHSHTYNSENNHTHSSLTNPGTHIHNPWSTDDGRPAYYEVAFVIYTVIFPTQYPGLRAQIAGSMQELCLVATGDGNPAITGKLHIAKGGIIYNVYLVETGDPNASAIRIMTPSGVKAIRKKT